MYRHCLFCNRELDANEVIESFPVGRRLAFDSERGRLWVVCRRCERWNLTPLEERWEAVEDCERTFRGLRTRVTTENVGLARHPAGLDLVRVGRPLRPEFAAWRYGDQFGRRRKRYIWYSALGAAVVGGVVAGGLAAGAISGVFLGQSGNLVNAWRNGRTRVRFRDSTGALHKLKLPQLNSTRLLAGPGGELQVELWTGDRSAATVYEGGEARRLAGIVMPALNNTGAKRDMVRDAVGRIEEVGHPERFIQAAIGEAEGTAPKRRRLSERQRRRRIAKRSDPLPESGFVSDLSRPSKLALEMALHEEQERRALEGELKSLELAWRQAEEIAAIEDELLLPADTDERLAALKDRAP